MGSKTKGHKQKHLKTLKKWPGDDFSHSTERPKDIENPYPDLSPEELHAKIMEEVEEHRHNLKYLDGSWVHPEFHVGEPDDREKVAAALLKKRNACK